MLSLVLSGLLWVNGLLQSFEEPTVGNVLNQRQLELAALAEPALPPALQEPLIGGDPLDDLREDLRSRLEDSAGPGEPETLLQLGLLEARSEGAAEARRLRERLLGQIPPDQRPLVVALEEGAPLPAAERELLSSPWSLSPLSERLVCEALSTTPERCTDRQQAEQALWRLVGVSWAPGLLLLAGAGLLLREGVLRLRGRAPAAQPLVGPSLDPVDVTLLIAGGFVVIGELGVPLVLAPAVQPLLRALDGDPALQQGVLILVLYLGLMAAPLAILWAQLRPLEPCRPEGGWLQWRWRPLPSTVLRGLAQVLMVLPLVALVGWLTEHLLGDQGGSNPLLELVLTTNQPLALACFAITAVVLAPLFEETLFRGVLLPVLGRSWGGGVAVVVSAVIFGVAHLSIGELAPLVVLGLGLGWLRLQGGRLGSCVLMHALWNGLTFTNLLLLAG
ncbi:CPBP family glutamic-type intramembrane protease [Aphanothece microscopica]